MHQYVSQVPSMQTRDSQLPEFWLPPVHGIHFSPFRATSELHLKLFCRQPAVAPILRWPERAADSLQSDSQWKIP